MKKITIILLVLLVSLGACTKIVINEKPCTREYRPVCCEGVEYPNQCMADNDQAKFCEAGPCDEENCTPGNKICDDVYEPYCCDGIEYSNYCFAMNDCAENCIKGECSETYDNPKCMRPPSC